MLIGAVLFYVLHLIFKSNELNTMSVIMCVIALGAVLKDDMIAGDDLPLYVLPLFYGIITSAISLIPVLGEGERK